MSRKIVLSALTAALMSGSALAQQPPAPKLPIVRGNSALKSHGIYIDELVADFMAQHRIPGMTMAIVQAPYIPRSAGYGRTSLDHDELASTKTMWNIGPVGQAFNAVAVMQLKEQGKLALTDPISKYVPGLPKAWSQITLMQLMQHSSGIADYRGKIDPAKHYMPAQLIDLVRDAPLRFRNGTKVMLSATDSTLLAMAVERASGMSYHDFVWKNQIEVEGLQSTMFVEDMAAKAAIDRPDPTPTNDNQHSHFKSQVFFINPVEPATGYREVGGQMVVVPATASANFFGFGDIWSSAEDISKWDIGLAGSTLIKSEADRDVVYKPTRLDNGTVVPAMSGWEFTHHPGFMEVKGDSPGFSSYLSRFTAADELVCVTLLANKEGVDLTWLAREIAAAYSAHLGPAVDQKEIRAEESKFGPAETVARIKAELVTAKVPVFATFDHAANAQSSGDQLRPTTVIVFGNPKVGTKLMQQDQAVGLDLPLRVLVWQDAMGRTWIGRPNLQTLAERHGLKDDATIAAMDRYLDGLVDHAADVYAY